MKTKQTVTKLEFNLQDKYTHFSIDQSLSDSVLGIVCHNFIRNDETFSTRLLFDRTLKKSV